MMNTENYLCRGFSPNFRLKLKIKVICAVAARRCSFFSEKKLPDRRTASSDFSPARRSRHGQNPLSFPPLRTTLVEVVADAILVPMQIAPVCTRITTLGVCRRGRFSIGVLHLAPGRAQCNGDGPILVTAHRSGFRCRRTSSPRPPQPTGHQRNLLADHPGRCSGARARGSLTRSRFRPEVQNRDFAAGGRRALRQHPVAPTNASAHPRGFLSVIAIGPNRQASPSGAETTEMAVSDFFGRGGGTGRP